MSRSTLFALLLLSACDDKEPVKTTPSATVSAAPTPTPTTPPTPKAPIVTIEDSAAMVGDARVDFAGPDVNGQIKAAVSSKKIEGETINVIASKDAKASKIAQVTNAIAAAKPKAIVVKTPKRDRSTGEINVALAAKREGCAAIGYIAKDSVISVWPASGAKAVTFSHGMAGPDMTRGSEGVRQAISKCDAPYWFASADADVKWGLVADLIFAVESPEDAGAPPKAHDVSILIKATPGRKIDDEP